jgi:hypothetical protein
MTHATSLLRSIAGQREALVGLQGALRVERKTGDDSWNARETLLHLLGSVEAARGNVAGTAGSWLAVQAGGEYVDRPEVETAPDACAALLRELDALGDDLRHLDDQALARPIAVSDGDFGQLADVPVGLAVRHLLTEHFDEHVAQLREALAV